VDPHRNRFRLRRFYGAVAHFLGVERAVCWRYLVKGVFGDGEKEG